MNVSDVIIIGGGVIGCSIAYNLSKKGVKVLVIEEKEIGHGGSSRNGGGVRQSARDLRELPLAMYAVKNIWPNLSEELGTNVEYYQSGNLRLGKTEEHMKILENVVSQGRSLGLELDIISQQEVREICPYCSDEVIGASYCKTDGHGNPMLTTLAYYKKAIELGAKFIVGEKVESITFSKGKIDGVKTKTDEYKAPKVIVAAGLESRKIINKLGIDVPMQGVLVEAMITEAQPQMFAQMIGTAASDFYGHQTEHGSFVFGGMTGIEPFASLEEEAVTRNVTAPSISRAILKYFPILENANITRTWAGFLDITADKVPVLSEVDEIPGLILACGFSGHGYGISPIVGVLMSQMVLEEALTLPLDAFRYDRFLPKA